MAGRRRVAVTGMGVVCATAWNVAGFTEALFAGRSGVTPIAGEFLPRERLTVTTAAQIHADFSDHFDRRQLIQLDRVCQMALIAGREAWAQSDPRPEPTRAGAILGASVGLETFDEGSRAVYGENTRRLSPMTVPRIMPNAPASQCAMAFGLKGPTFSIGSACASANHSIGVAANMIRAGAADVMMAGGSDSSMTLGFLKAWDALRVLSPDICRPFSRNRPGLVLGEGAGILVLEDWDRACDRGATILAEILGFGMTADAGDLLAPDRDGARRAMQGALDDAGLGADRIDYVNAHGTGTKLNDLTESAAIGDLVGAGRLAHVPVTSTKSMVGHCLNAAGAIEAVATIVALQHGRIPPTIGFVEADPECPVDCVPNEARHMAIEVALSNSFAFGGLNATLAIGRAS